MVEIEIKEEEVLRKQMNAIIVVKRVIGEMNVEAQLEEVDLGQEVEEEDHILAVQEVDLKDIIKKENIHLAVAEVNHQNIKNQEEIELKVLNQDHLQDLLDLNHQDRNQIQVKVIV